MVMDEKEKLAIAYHESGHAVVAGFLPGTDPVHKVTIMPRGRALGLTWQLPEKDVFSKYKDQLLNEIAILFGGRAAEEIFLGRISTGASNDIERATKIAREMVTTYGMSEELGQMFLASEQDEVFLGRSTAQSASVSQDTMKKIDKTVHRFLEKQFQLAKSILEEKRAIVEIMTAALMKWETIERAQVIEIMQGKEPSPPADYSHNLEQIDSSNPSTGTESAAT